MTLCNTSTTYGSVSKFFHWVIFLLLFLMVILGYAMGYIPKNSPYMPIVFNIHKLTGLSVLLLMLLRLIWMLTNTRPALPLDTRIWERWVERLVQGLLYLVVIVMPLSGWIGSSAAGKPPHIGALTFQLPISHSKVIAGNAFVLHRGLAITLIVLFCIHLLAALYHAIIKKDNILQRMLPHSHAS